MVKVKPVTFHFRKIGTVDLFYAWQTDDYWSARTTLSNISTLTHNAVHCLLYVS